MYVELGDFQHCGSVYSNGLCWTGAEKTVVSVVTVSLSQKEKSSVPKIHL